MRTIAEIAQEHFGVSTWGEADELLVRAMKDYDPPRTTPTHLSIPYIADNCPEEPPPDEIQKACIENTLHARLRMNYVFRVRDMVYKIGAAQQIIEEAENLIYLEHNSQVRVPKVYKVYAGHPKHGHPQTIMVMEFIEGFELKYEDWIHFTEEERTTLYARLEEQYHLLRSIPSEGYYGRIHRQAFDRNMGMFRTNCKQSSGPYETYEEFTSAVNRSAEVYAMMSRLQKGEHLYEDQDTLLSEYKLALETSTDRKPVFTHVDPDLKNIIFRRLPGTHDQPPDWEVTLIDWDGAGWFPAWVQGAAFAQRFGIWDKSGNVYVDLAKEFIARAYGNMECGAELVRICTEVRWTITQSIY
ncbi:hypothetical protein EJ07DRAFT_154933 [Lizonia empirigonia]|nr:hypothetical protein EJ07DRAFT_154933 [Lizonia empirigonia]